jgi:hypothetical protein
MKNLLLTMIYQGYQKENKRGTVQPGDFGAGCVDFIKGSAFGDRLAD